MSPSPLAVSPKRRPGVASLTVGLVDIYHGSVPFDGNTGEVIVTISRSGTTIAQMTGKSITTDCTNGIENWNAWVGSATSSETISATPALDIAEQVCVEGTGVYNFAGLCEFACNLGYCPIGACICLLMGAQHTKPNATGVEGYPLSGEDPSYAGLCSFDCNYGYCPDAACATVSVPLPVPTVSDFDPPACIAGEGEGNLAGLCSFCCNYGYCPMLGCTCTEEGGLVEAPAATAVNGIALATDDPVQSGLCNFACEHGYCPSGACTAVAATATGAGGGSGDVYIGPGVWSEPSPVLPCIPPCNLIIPPLPLTTTSTIHIPPWVTSVVESYPTTRTTTLVNNSTMVIPGYCEITVTTTLNLPEGQSVPVVHTVVLPFLFPFLFLFRSPSPVTIL
jgi:hypothetical protein